MVALARFDPVARLLVSQWAALSLRDAFRPTTTTTADWGEWATKASFFFRG